jgi:uncharacterized damage-inducible protein DinB
MIIASSLLAEFEQEAKTTRKFLEQLPEDKLLWKPHEKSMTAGQLAMHIAVAPGAIIKMASLDEREMPDFRRPNPQPESKKQILDAFESSVVTVRETLPNFTDDQMHSIWRMTREGKEILAIPRAAVCRSLLLNHWYHHRGQFGVYLRLVGATVPSSYGPSGDELPDFAK